MDKKVLKKNDELTLCIERLGANGEGIATYEGKIIFVPFACVGEKVLVHIIFDKKNFYVAKLIKVLSESKERFVAPCPYFSKCGGCDIQHLSYEAQLKLKTKIVQTALEKYAKLNIEVNNTISSEKQFRYRNKFSFPVQSLDDGTVKIGMYKKNSHEICEIEDCLLQSEKAKTIIKIIKDYIVSEKIPCYNEKTKSGIIKHIVVREHEDSFILTIVVTDEKFNNFEPLINKLRAKFNSFGIVKNVNKLSNNVIFGKRDEFIYGLKELDIDEFNVKYQVNNRSFFQVNNDVKSKIYKKIISEINDAENVIDAYSGAGLLSAILAKHSDSVYGIEIVPEASANAEKLKEKNGLKNLTNICGDCVNVLPELSAKLKSNFSLIIDPPRKGIDKKVLDSIIVSLPKQIIYLSCNPATLARDLEVLKEKYKINFVQPYDMFPQTANVETLVKLSLKED